MQQYFLALQLSFMLEEAPTSGSVNSTAEEKQQLAAQSLDFNVSFKIWSRGGCICSCNASSAGGLIVSHAAQVANLQFRRLFPGWVERQQQGKQEEGQAQVCMMSA